jgi:hypothetical protein
MAKAMQEIIQAPAALCGTSVLTAAALAVQQHGNIEIDGRICPASLYGVTVAVSGERKSAVDREALAPHRKYQHDCFEASKEELLSYEADRDAFAKVREGIHPCALARTKCTATPRIRPTGGLAAHWVTAIGMR